ncbi:MAG: tRNA adenosine(34) deaminase TadA [Gammaproteobacteria bacterium]|nr:tRNA adenosine(34) deaminase TadA [Gammaproteobacteria bacterium]
MRQALALAEHAARRGEVPVGAVLVRDDGSGDELVGQGSNRVIGSSDPTAHAEIIALREAAARLGNYRLPGTTLYVTLEPCLMCAGALVHARVKRLVFGAREPRTGAVISHGRALETPAHNHRVDVREGVLAEECASLMQRFFRERR